MNWTSSVAAFSAFIALLTDVAAACSFMSHPALPLGPTWLPRSCEIDTSERWSLAVSEWSMCDYNSECRPSPTEDGKIICFAVGRVNGPARPGTRGSTRRTRRSLALPTDTMMTLVQSQPGIHTGPTGTKPRSATPWLTAYPNQSTHSTTVTDAQVRSASLTSPASWSKLSGRSGSALTSHQESTTCRPLRLTKTSHQRPQARTRHIGRAAQSRSAPKQRCSLTCGLLRLGVR